MSNERSPRDVCSTTIGTSGIPEPPSTGREKRGLEERPSLAGRLGVRGGRAQLLGGRVRREVAPQELPDGNVHVAAEGPLRFALYAPLPRADRGRGARRRRRGAGVLGGEACG